MVSYLAISGFCRVKILYCMIKGIPSPNNLSTILTDRSKF